MVKMAMRSNKVHCAPARQLFYRVKGRKIAAFEDRSIKDRFLSCSWDDEARINQKGILGFWVIDSKAVSADFAVSTKGEKLEPFVCV